ncbi:hypothetical protein OG585_47285 (plasmid) [Streptomyces sp. NBC_01340]|uniref:hypothetical protein n=1 Tax=unclassified Streptomyces TaxID=2593676 RepID=UPI0022546FE2|nr:MULTISPECIES: hypothetical protein [unclassified Streptomyces]MCX4461144.1 hypothetical protein [Streptomyces sp. NBC_01719]MCX4499527.1 hypothetical protein [Streptomyces sp. NBC_01728]WSI44666.1 hypothetical protein OG585_47285 [Streptomyces sp. NBC_01340]
MYFPPVPNGLDYLLSAVEHLEASTERVSARDLKYAVLHLAAGTEVLLKARLQLEHWSLVFTDPAKAKRAELENGSLLSCGPDETVQRLRDIAGVQITEKDRKALSRLAKDRNALQHYGLFGQSANARAVESRAAEVLDFLIRFVDEDLLPALPPEEAEAAQSDLERIRGGLAEIEGFVKQRMQRLRAELETLRDRTLQCPDCRQWALVVEPTQAQGAARASRCRFCGMSRDAEDIALIYGVEILGRDPGMVDMLTLLTATDHCPHCELESLVEGVRFAADPDTSMAFCFQCTRLQPALTVCVACGHTFRPADGATSCENCTTVSAPHHAP